VAEELPTILTASYPGICRQLVSRRCAVQPAVHLPPILPDPLHLPRAAATVSDLAAHHQYNDHNILLTLRTALHTFRECLRAEWSGRLAVMMFSICATLALWKINPRTWLNWYFEACAESGGRAPDNPDGFLPWNLSTTRLAEMRGTTSRPSAANTS
jgi:hypothetical protein